MFGIPLSNNPFHEGIPWIKATNWPFADESVRWGLAVALIFPQEIMKFSWNSHEFAMLTLRTAKRVVIGNFWNMKPVKPTNKNTRQLKFHKMEWWVPFGWPCGTLLYSLKLVSSLPRIPDLVDFVHEKDFKRSQYSNLCTFSSNHSYPPEV